MVKFVIAGHTVDPNTFEDALTRLVLEGIRTEIQEKVGTIRDPNTGEFPTVVVSGDSLDDLKVSRIAVMAIPQTGLGLAINDRLRRAAADDGGKGRG